MFYSLHCFLFNNYTLVFDFATDFDLLKLKLYCPKSIKAATEMLGRQARCLLKYFIK